MGVRREREKELASVLSGSGTWALFLGGGGGHVILCSSRAGVSGSSAGVECFCCVGGLIC